MTHVTIHSFGGGQHVEIQVVRPGIIEGINRAYAASKHHIAVTISASSGCGVRYQVDGFDSYADMIFYIKQQCASNLRVYGSIKDSLPRSLLRWPLDFELYTQDSFNNKAKI
jgi:hypothetical protein